MEAIFFNGWSVLGRTLLIGVLAYVSLVFMLRVSGKRTLAKMNAFDLLVTVAIGSTLATIVLSKSVAVRSAGIGALGDVAAVVLETDGSFSVIAGQPGAALSSLDGVK